MTIQELYEKIGKIFLPIIAEDSDIANCIKRNNFTEEERQYFYLWLLNASIAHLFGKSDDDLVKKLATSCKNGMKHFEQKFRDAGYDDDVEDVLWEIFNDNIGEWKAILAKAIVQLQGKGSSTTSTRRTRSDTGNTSGKSKAKDYIRFYTMYLCKVLNEDENAQEFFDSYSQIAHEALTAFLALNIFYSLLFEIKKGNMTPPSDWPGLSCLDEMINLAQNMMGNICADHFHDIDGDQFNQDMSTLVNKHFREFISAMVEKMDEDNE